MKKMRKSGEKSQTPYTPSVSMTYAMNEALKMVMEEGLEVELLDQIVESMAKQAKEAGVTIVAGDTKVVEGNKQIKDKINETPFINYLYENNINPK